jgi:GTP-binding protein YchF
MKRVGILGLPQSGKTTLFEILLQGAGASAPPGASARDRVGVVRVPDERIDRLTAMFTPKKTVLAQIQFVDSAAAGQGKPGKGQDLFTGVRQCDALLAVVRDFESPSVPAPKGVDAARDLRELEAELVLNDLAIVETRLERIEKELKIGKKEAAAEGEVLKLCRVELEAERPLRTVDFTADQIRLIRGFQFLTLKPLLVVWNQDENSMRQPPAAGRHALAIALRAHTEREIVSLPPEERAAFRAELGVAEDGLSLVIRSCYELLGLISFFTVGPDEVRAWEIHRGDSAVDAAGEIHSDLARGFIRAEVVPYGELVALGGLAKAREKGVLRLEGREYRVQDGDCLEIRHNA